MVVWHDIDVHYRIPYSFRKGRGNHFQGWTLFNFYSPWAQFAHFIDTFDQQERQPGHRGIRQWPQVKIIRTKSAVPPG
jgi:hypothetical protein